MLRRSARRSPGIDMTPMVDLGFLLVTFFMMTTQFLPVEPVSVSVPRSVSETKAPDADITTIFVSKEGAVFFRMDGGSMRLLGEKLNGKHHLGLTEGELDAFASQGGIGTPLTGLKSFLSLPEEERKSLAQPGIPLDAAHDELADWISYSRITNPNSRFLLKADGGTPYPVIKQVMGVLQDCRIDRFSLITDTERGGA